MVTSGSDEEDRLSILEHWGDDCHVWEMGASGCGMVAQDDVTFSPRIAEGLDLVPDSILHGTKMNWQVRGVRHQAPLMVEKGAREIEPLLDVDTGSCSLERDSHLLGDRHESVTEYGQLYGIEGNLLDTFELLCLGRALLAFELNLDVSILVYESPPERFN
jgi:hypothetical protein